MTHTVKKTMAVDLVACPSCRKQNKTDGRYCIHCGSILRPVYCSNCGTPNPDDLPQCLECGTALPDLSDIRWNPVVTVLQPTSAMVNDVQFPSELEPEPEPTRTEKSIRRLLSRIVEKLSRRDSLAGSDG